MKNWTILIAFLMLILLAGCSKVPYAKTEQKEQPEELLSNALEKAQNIITAAHIELGETEARELTIFTKIDDTHYKEGQLEVIMANGIVNEVNVILEHPVHLTSKTTTEYTGTLTDDIVYEWKIEDEQAIGLSFKRTSKTLKQQVYELPLQEKVGQMLMIGMEGTKYTGAVQSVLDENIGNIILFKKNIESVEQLRTLISDIDTHSKSYPTWIAIDEEGGTVSRMPNELVKLPTAAQLAANHTPEQVGQIAEKLGEALVSNGIDIDFAPIFDVNSNPNNPVIGNRAFSSDVIKVSSYATSFANGLSQTGIIPVAKHFPGHGDTSVDSHKALPVINKTYEELDKLELKPFKAAVEEGIDAIMVGHLFVPALDDNNPTSLSHKAISELLREQWGYKGLIISDDLTMKALNMPLSEAILQAITAGNDIALANGSLEEVLAGLDKVVQAVENGQIPVSQINASAYRIISRKTSQPVADFNVYNWNDEMKQLLK